MARVEHEEVESFKDVDLEAILARVERRGPLMLARKRSLYRAPEFVKRLAQEITVDEGSTVCFDCKVVAFPNPAITWTKDNESLPSDTRFETETLDNGGYALKINDVTKKDEAAYRCRAENVEALKKDKPKKTSSGLLAHAQTFPVIKEEVEEEEAEAEFFRNQPDSPLTSLYCGTRWKNRTWPDFLNHQSLAVNYYDDDLGSMMDSDEDDVFLSESGNDVNGVFPVNNQDNSDSDSEMANVITQNLVFENRNFSGAFPDRPNGTCRLEQDINANTCTSSSKQNGDVRHSRKILTEESRTYAFGNNRKGVMCVDNDNSLCSDHADECAGPILSDVTGLNIAVLVLLISGYTFLALKWNLDPRTFVSFELFVEFLFLMIISLLD